MGEGPLLDDPTPRNLKLAFFGDQALTSLSRANLELVAAEGAHAIVHQGDFDYKDDPVAWEAQIDAILGADYPYFASVGNHDKDVYYSERGYQDVLAERMQRVGVPWVGDLGVQSALSFQGIFMVFTAPGVFGEGDGYHDAYIREQLAADDSTWRISSWHKNMTAMQLGAKGNATGWGVYEESRRGGAIVATGHEHSYSRTHLLSNCQKLEVSDRGSSLTLVRDDPTTPEDEGRTVVFVSGLGGKSARVKRRGGDHWAAMYTEEMGATAGVLFGVFNYEGDPNRARFYFKTIEGELIDEFELRSGKTPGRG